MDKKGRISPFVFIIIIIAVSIVYNMWDSMFDTPTTESGSRTIDKFRVYNVVYNNGPPDECFADIKFVSNDNSAVFVRYTNEEGYKKQHGVSNGERVRIWGRDGIEIEPTNYNTDCGKKYIFNINTNEFKLEEEQYTEWAVHQITKESTIYIGGLDNTQRITSMEV